MEWKNVGDVKFHDLRRQASKASRALTAAMCTGLSSPAPTMNYSHPSFDRYHN